MADNTDRISEIREILRSGVKSFSNDGTVVTHDFAELRRELRELEAEDDTVGGRRPSSFRADLSGF